MVFNRIKPISMTDMFINELKRMILSGELKPGTKLPPEREIAKDMGVSLAVVNAGIIKLTELHFLKVKPRKGVYVDDYLKSGSINTLMEIITFYDDPIDADMLELTLHIRTSIEQTIYRKICENHAGETITVLENCNRQIEAEEDPENKADLCYEFVHTAALCCGNQLYAMFVQTFKDTYVFFVKYSIDNGFFTAEDFCDQHNNLIDALKSGDRDAVAAVVEKNVTVWGEKFKENLNYRRRDQ